MYIDLIGRIKYNKNFSIKHLLAAGLIAPTKTATLGNVPITIALSNVIKSLNGSKKIQETIVEALIECPSHLGTVCAFLTVLQSLFSQRCTKRLGNGCLDSDKVCTLG